MRIDDLVHARLITGARSSMAEVTKATARFAPTTVDPRGWAVQVQAAWDRLVAAEVIDASGDAGAAAPAPWPTFQLAGPVSWKRLVERIIPGLGLGVAPDDARTHAKLVDRDSWAAAIVARANGMWEPGRPPPTLAAVCDGIVWRGIGLAGAAKRTPPEIRAHFVGRVLGESATAHDRAIRVLAAREVGALRSDLRALRDALGRQWLAEADTAARTTPAPVEAPIGANLDELADAVRIAARDATAGVFGERKVFISSVWQALSGRPPVGRMDLPGFKQRLLEAHRAGLVSLVRADLVGVMDPALVAASEAVSGEARYHFVLREVIA